MQVSCEKFSIPESLKKENFELLTILPVEVASQMIDCEVKHFRIKYRMIPS